MLFEDIKPFIESMLLNISEVSRRSPKGKSIGDAILDIIVKIINLTC